jgi:hypothetical protein
MSYVKYCKSDTAKHLYNKPVPSIGKGTVDGQMKSNQGNNGLKVLMNKRKRSTTQW